MIEPIQEDSAEIVIDPVKEPNKKLPEVFAQAAERRKFEVMFFQAQKQVAFSCSDYAQLDVSPTVGKFDLTGEWLFTDVVLDTSKRDPQGKLTLARMTYHPQISLVNIPFMVIPVVPEKKSGEYPVKTEE